MKLVSGSGSEQTGACWMSALHWYTRRDRTWSDHPDCVSPVIRELCIRLNDMCIDGEREELIGKHLFASVGTNTGEADDQRRAYLCADRAIRVFAPIALRVVGLESHALALEAVAPIVDVVSAEAAWAARAKTKQELLRLILDCCAIGAKAEICATRTRIEVLDLVGATTGERERLAAAGRKEAGND